MGGYFSGLRRSISICYITLYFWFFLFNYYKKLLKFYNHIFHFYYYLLYLATSLMGYIILFSSLLLNYSNKINNNSNKSKHSTIIKFILIINLIKPIFPYNNMYSFESNLSIIKLKIKGIGKKKYSLVLIILKVVIILMKYI